MEFAKPGEIKTHCQPNALSTFVEYLTDFASPETRKIGEELVTKQLTQMQEPVLNFALNLVSKVRAGKRDVYM